MEVQLTAWWSFLSFLDASDVARYMAPEVFSKAETVTDRRTETTRSTGTRFKPNKYRILLPLGGMSIKPSLSVQYFLHPPADYPNLASTDLSWVFQRHRDISQLSRLSNNRVVEGFRKELFHVPWLSDNHNQGQSTRLQIWAITDLVSDAAE